MLANGRAQIACSDLTAEDIPKILSLVCTCMTEFSGGYLRQGTENKKQNIGSGA